VSWRGQARPTKALIPALIRTLEIRPISEQQLQRSSNSLPPSYPRPLHAPAPDTQLQKLSFTNAATTHLLWRWSSLLPRVEMAPPTLLQLDLPLDFTPTTFPTAPEKLQPSICRVSSAEARPPPAVSLLSEFGPMAYRKLPPFARRRMSSKIRWNT
jgi:hypothetical protein